MPVSKNEKSDSMETEDEVPIQFGTLSPSNFSVNMAFTLPATFRAKEGQTPTIKGDIEEGNSPSASMVVEGNRSKEPSNIEAKLEEFPIDQMKNDNVGAPEEGTRVIILKPKKTEDEVVKPVKVVLERPSTRMAQHLKPL